MSETSAPSTSPLPTIAIISLGSMGIGVAKLLLAHHYPVFTSLQDRSSATRTRAEATNVKCYDTDAALVAASDVVLSIVPPEHAHATAKRVADAAKGTSRTRPLIFMELNAISPQRARDIAALFTTTTTGASGNEQAKLEDKQPAIICIDGGIIGGPPRLKDDGSWYSPSLILSGPSLSSSTPSGDGLATLLNTTHISRDIGSASGLKMCFASMTKGLTAIAIQAFTTASRLGVEKELVRHLERYSPKTGDLVKGGLVGMPPKAYRWVAEMEMIGETFGEDGGFESGEGVGRSGGGLFKEVAGVYDFVANGTKLGEEKTESRKRGLDTGDVAKLVAEGLDRKKQRKE